MDHVSVEIFRAALGDYLDRVFFRNESFVVTRNGIPFVLLAPVPQDAEQPDRINARDMRKQMSQLLGQVHFQGTDLLVVRRGKPTAILTSASAGRKQ
jgi:antitoxin (DNA-binding transcriptional repressor) of toxin-antitoxin stability system